MQDLQRMLEWWNLIFLLPFGLAVLYGLLIASGSVHHDHDFDAHVDHAADLHHGVGADHNAHAGHHAEHDSHGGNTVLRALAFLGVGKAPLGIVLSSFLLIWGFVGWGSNTILINHGQSPASLFWVSILVAFVAAIFFTRWIALAIARNLPSVESYATTNQDLVGYEAKVIYTITEDSGQARLRDRFGNLQDVRCRISPGSSAISEGSIVTLTDYNDEKQVFIVTLNQQES